MPLFVDGWYVSCVDCCVRVALCCFVLFAYWLEFAVRLLVVDMCRSLLSVCCSMKCAVCCLLAVVNCGLKLFVDY